VRFHWPKFSNVPAALREQIEAEGALFIADKVGVSKRFSGHVLGVYSAAGVSRYRGAFCFSTARIVATFPTSGDANLRSIDCSWDVDDGPATASISEKGLLIEIDLRRVDAAFSGTMKLNYKRKISDEVLAALPTRTLAFPVKPTFVYRAAGVRPK
jgi:hypothetical protein